jgi:regulator of sigma E protease
MLGGCAGVTAKIGCIGVQIAEPTKSFKPTAGEALTMSVQKNVEYARMIFQTLWGLITRETSPKQLMGPVAIAQLSGESAQLGWLALFTLMASISLNLGLLNLMPIPVLDGGHIFIMMLEGLARRDFSVRVKEKMLLAGFVVILMLMVTVIYNDLTRITWIERLMPWR